MSLSDQGDPLWVPLWNSSRPGIVRSPMTRLLRRRRAIERWACSLFGLAVRSRHGRETVKCGLRSGGSPMHDGCSTCRGLMAAVIQSPGDDVPRLVMADHYENDHGEAA